MAAGVVFNIRERPVLAGLYAVALAEFVILLPTVTAKLTITLAQAGFAVPGA